MGMKAIMKYQAMGIYAQLIGLLEETVLTV